MLQKKKKKKLDQKMRVYKYAPSSVEITSVMNGSQIHERWMEWSELYQRIKKISNFGLDYDPFHLLIRVVSYLYPYPDFVDLMTYPFWAWHDITPWYHYTTDSFPIGVSADSCPLNGPWQWYHLIRVQLVSLDCGP